MSDLDKVEEIIVSNTATLLNKFNQFSTKLAYDLYYNTNLSHPQTLTYLSIILTAISLAVIGSYATLEKPQNALAPSKPHPLFDPSDFDTKSDDETSMTGTSAASMPIIGGVVLMALYYGIKNISKETLMYYLKNYIVFMSVVPNFNSVNFLIKSVARNFAYYFSSSTPFKYFKLTLSHDEDYNPFGIEEHYFMDDSSKTLRIIKEEKLNASRSPVEVKYQFFNFYFSTAEMISIPIAMCLTVLYHKIDANANWLLSNTMAFSFTIFGIQSVHVTNVKTSVILLLGLFFYDIYFVFGTEVMETVALGLDIPLKIMIPRAGAKIITDTALPMSILGLGDVVMPSTFISLCLRFDLWKFHNANKYIEFHHLQRFNKTYFTASLVGYTIGLIITMGVLEIYKTGQPALLYLVPSVLFSVFITALLKGDLQMLLQYEEKTKEDLIDPNFKVSEGTLRLLELDEEEEEDEDDEYVYEEDTVVVMDQYLDEIDDDDDDDDDSEVEEVSIFSDDDEDEDETPSMDEYVPEYIPTAYVFDIPTDSDSDDEDFVPQD